MKFKEIRTKLAKNEKLTDFTLSGYGTASGKDNNGLIQIYKPHWFPYYKFKNLSQPELIKSFLKSQII